MQLRIHVGLCDGKIHRARLLPYSCMDLVSDCRQTSHETSINSGIDRENVRVSLSVSSRCDGFAIFLDSVLCGKLPRGVRDDLVDRIRRIDSPSMTTFKTLLSCVILARSACPAAL